MWHPCRWCLFTNFDDDFLRPEFLAFSLGISSLSMTLHCSRHRLVIYWLICSLTTISGLHGPGGKSTLSRLTR